MSKMSLFFTLSVTNSNFNNLITGELVASRFFTAGIINEWLSALAVHVLHIVSMGALKEMRWIATWRIVAFMTDKHPRGNWAFGKFERDTMGQCIRFVMDKTISSRVSRASPKPTLSLENWVNRAILVNLFPKTLFDWTRRVVSTVIFVVLTFCDACSTIGFFGYACWHSAATHAKARRIWRFGTRKLATIVTMNKWLRLPHDVTESRIACDGDASFLPAPTHAKTARVGKLDLLTSASPLMSKNVAERLALYPSMLRARHVGNIGLFAATAMAVAVRNFVRGIIGVHRNLPFCVKPGTLTRRLALCVGSHTSSIAQVSA